MKTLIIASMFATLLATSTAFAVEWPTNPQQPKGTEGPDVQHSQIVIPRGAPDWPDVR